MSLINEALKRAKEAQQGKAAPRPEEPPLRPADRGPAPHSSLWLSLAFAIMLATGAILIGQWLHSRERQTDQHVSLSPPPAAHAPVFLPAERSSIEEGPPVLADSQVVSEAAVLAEPPAPIVEPPPRTIGAATIPEAVDAGSASASPATATSAPVAAEVQAAAPAEEPPPAPVLKLQGIIYHPTRPSAVVNSKTLFMGDRLGEWQVAAIDTRTVTLTSETRTNVMELP